MRILIYVIVLLLAFGMGFDYGLAYGRKRSYEPVKGNEEIDGAKLILSLNKQRGESE